MQIPLGRDSFRVSLQASLRVVLLGTMALTCACYGDAAGLLQGRTADGGVFTWPNPDAPSGPGSGEDAGVDPGTDGGEQQGAAFECDPAEQVGKTVAHAAGLFSARVYPLLVRDTQGCIGCHHAAATRTFRVSSDAEETFHEAYAHGLLGDGPQSLLARVQHADPVFRMPLNAEPWSTEEINAVAEVACVVKSLEPPVCQPGEVRPGVAFLRRLTHREYDNTLAVLLNPGKRIAETTFAPGLRAEGWFDNEASSLIVDETLARNYMKAAESVTAIATANLLVLMGCTNTVNDFCARRFLKEDFGPRAYRRPLTPEEQTRIDQLYDASKLEWSNIKDAVQVVMQAMLQSPHFLYRVEAPPATVDARPSSWEMASRLSYLYWQTMPDEELWSLAKDDLLRDPAVIAVQAARLRSDPRARAVVSDFHHQWLSLHDVLEISKDPAVFPTFDESLRPLFIQETETFLEDLFWNTPGAPASQMLAAKHSFMNKALADYYGIPGPTGAEFVKVPLPANRAGILSQASFLTTQALADQTHPVYRGNFVLTRLLGVELGAPPSEDPNGNPIDLPAVDPTRTTRERFAEHSNNAACAGCHKVIDPIGFALENYDAAGLWRDTEAGKGIDASATLVSPTSVAGTISGPVELFGRMSQSPDFHRAIVERWFAFAYGRRPSAADACTVSRLEQGFSASGHDLQALFGMLATTDAFVYRGEVNGGLP